MSMSDSQAVGVVFTTKWEWVRLRPTGGEHALLWLHPCGSHFTALSVWLCMPLPLTTRYSWGQKIECMLSVMGCFPPHGWKMQPYRECCQLIIKKCRHIRLKPNIDVYFCVISYSCKKLISNCALNWQNDRSTGKSLQIMTSFPQVPTQHDFELGVITIGSFLLKCQ